MSSKSFPNIDPKCKMVNEPSNPCWYKCCPKNGPVYPCIGAAVIGVD